MAKSKMAAFTIRLPAEIYEWLGIRAETVRRSRTGLVLEILTAEYLSELSGPNASKP